MALPSELPQQVAAVFRNHLLHAFPSTITFDPILVEPMVGWQGDDNLHITIVCDGDLDLLDGDKLNKISVAMWPELEALGFYKIPVESYVDKVEWEDWNSLSEEEQWAELMGLEHCGEITDELGSSD